MIWRQGIGFINLRELLMANGVDMTNWTLDFTHSLSDDGLTISGDATYHPPENPANYIGYGFWVTIPTPGTTVVLVLGAAPLLHRNRRVAR